MFKKTFFLALVFMAMTGFSFGKSTDGNRLSKTETPALFFDCSGGGLETFANLGSSSSSYATRTWTGNNSVAWSATDARTDQDLTGDAIALRTSTLKNTTTVAGGIGTLSFNYQRVFTGNSTLKVYVNGVQYGGDITVSATTTTVYSQVINVNGNVVIEIKNSGNRIIVDDLAWNCYAAPVLGPELQLADASAINVACGALAVDFGSHAVATNHDAIFTIKNTGTSALNVSGLSLSNATDFSIISPASTFSVSASGSQIVLVRFNSATSGIKTGTLTIASNDADEASCVVNLSGTAVAPCVAPVIEDADIEVLNITATTADVDITNVTADNYLVLTGTAGSLGALPADGVTYLLGATIGTGTVAYNGPAVDFSLSGLLENTAYTVYVFPYNNLDCTEGPLYNIEVSIKALFETPVAPCLGGLESFSNLGSSSSTYALRTWTGDNSVPWSATDARTDQDLTGDAIAIRTGTLTNTTPVSGGMGTLTFNYKRVFTGNSTLKVFVNGVQYGGDITVSADTTTLFSQAIEVDGPITIEIQNSGNRTIVDDLSWNCYETPNRPEIQLLDSEAALKACGDFSIALGNVLLNTDSEKIFSIENKGLQDLEIATLALSDAVNYTIVSPATPFTVDALATQLVTVRFNSTTLGSKPMMLAVESNDGDEASCVVNFTATAVGPCLAPNPLSGTIATSNITFFSFELEVAGVTADGYIAVVSGGAIDAPINGTTYVVGDNLGAGTVAYVGTASTFTVSGLDAETTYQLYIFPYNSTSCVGGPVYAENALEDEVTTPDVPCVGGSETFSNLGSSSSAYATRTWTGDNSVNWSATDARTDQDLTGDAIALRTSTLTNTTSVSGGIGTLTFNYKRVFTGNSTMKVFVNGTQYGGDITVSSDTTILFSQVINATGNVTVEVRNSGNRIVVDDISWNCFEGGSKMANVKKATEVTVYPNPNSGQFQLELPGDAHVEIFNMSGTLMLSKKVSPKETINLGNAAKGLYLVKVTSSNGVSTKKVFVE